MNQSGRKSIYVMLAAAAAGLLAAAPPAPQLVWEGVVEGVSVLSIRGNRVQVEERGAPVQGQSYKFKDPLPDSRQEVRARAKEGRGRVAILQQPGLANDYTLVVEIENRGRCALEFFWDAGRGGFATNLPKGPLPRRGMVWSGHVEGRARVTVQGRQAEAEARDGGRVETERATFDRELPRRDNPATTARLVRGTGTLEIVEYPSRPNGYKLVFEIRGAGDYEIEAGW